MCTGSYFNELCLIFGLELKWLTFLNSILGKGHHAEDALLWILGKMLINFWKFITVCIADLPCFAENLQYFDKDINLAAEHITNIIASKELWGYTTDTLPTACMHTAQLSRDFLAGGQII